MVLGPSLSAARCWLKNFVSTPSGSCPDVWSFFDFFGFLAAAGFFAASFAVAVAFATVGASSAGAAFFVAGAATGCCLSLSSGAVALLLLFFFLGALALEAVDDDFSEALLLYKDEVSNCDCYHCAARKDQRHGTPTLTTIFLLPCSVLFPCRHDRSREGKK